jgi:glyoxylase-like metal-dependent hydrolase (beta-lactamase superfamily II)
MREKTIIYFFSEVNRGATCGDCMLLENIDSNGVIRHALIDSGFSINFNGIRLLFQKHNVKKLEFFCITHSHGDHNGGAIHFLNNFPVDLIIMKEFDSYWSPGGSQGQYEKIIMKAIDKNIKILGVSYVSLGSSEYSPSRSETFKTAITKAKEENFTIKPLLFPKPLSERYF